MSTVADNRSALKQLQELGLTQRESNLYLALVETGRSTATYLSKKIGVPRASIYLSLKRLQELGLIETEQRQRGSYFTAARPEAIRVALEKASRSIDRKLEVANTLASLLDPFFSRIDQSAPEFKVVEGARSINAFLLVKMDDIRASLMNTDRTWWGFEDHTFSEQYGEWLKEYWRRYWKKDGTGGELVRLISNESKIQQLHGRLFGPEVGRNRQIHCLPGTDSFASSVLVAGEYVLVISTRNAPHRVIQLKDKNAADSLRAIFKIVWSSLRAG